MNLILVVKILQIFSAIALIILVLIQTKSGGLSNSVGGSINMYRSKRGLEKVVLILTIFFGVTLVLNSIVLVSLG